MSEDALAISAYSIVKTVNLSLRIQLHWPIVYDQWILIVADRSVETLLSSLCFYV